MKRKLILLSAVVICIAIAAAGTLAYFTADTTAHNVITSGGVDIDIREWADKELKTPFVGPVSGVMPGQEATKIVKILNEPEPEKNPSAEAWIRAKIDVKVELKNGEVINNDPNVILVNEGNTKWQMGGDGYYYYTEKVATGAYTEPLLTSVKFAPEMGNDYQNCSVTISITAEAVQTAHNPDPVDDGSNVTVWNATGWPGSDPAPAPDAGEGEGESTDESLPLEGKGDHEVVDEVSDTDAAAEEEATTPHQSASLTASPQGEAIDPENP